MMTALLARLEGRSIVLHATEAARQLYASLGFQAEGVIRQYQGAPFGAGLVPLPEGQRLRPLGRSDPGQLAALDRAATGLGRGALLRALLQTATGIVLDRGGAPAGFALLRRFGRGQVIGPVVAPDAHAAQVLISHFLGHRTGQFIRVDVPDAAELGPWLTGLGLSDAGPGLRMVRGPPVAARRAQRIHVRPGQPGFRLAPIACLYKSEPNRGAAWQRRFAEQVPDLPFRIWPDAGDPAEIQYIVAWHPPDDLHRYPNLRVLLSVGAGVDQLDLFRVPPGVQVVRMIGPGLVAGMVEYVTMAVLALHRGLPDYLTRQRQGAWQANPVRLASQAPVGVMDLGLLGAAVLERLAAFGFPLHGWSRSPRAMAGVATYAGPAALPGFLAASSILVCLFPLTPGTTGSLDRRLFEALPGQASLVHVGRGGHLIADDLLDALASGHLRAAVLDVTDPEPLPPGHPIWGHERIWLTPHVASATQAESGAQATIANIRRDRCGAPLAGLVHRDRGY